MRPKIVIADDHILVATGLEEIIEQFNEYDVLYKVGNGQELQEKFKQARNIPDIVLLDISMPVMNGFETAAWLQQDHPDVKIIVLAGLPDDASLVKMIELGVAGFLSKTVHPSEFKEAIDSVVRTGNYTSKSMGNSLWQIIAKQNKLKAQLKGISDREKEFLLHVCTKMTYVEIAAKMFCSARTVHSYRDSLFQKLDMNTRMELAMYAVEHGLCKP